MAKPAIDLSDRYTYRQYCEWSDTERWELIDGIAWSMSPAPDRRHQGICGSLYRQFSNFLEGKSCRIYFSPFDLLLPELDEADDRVVAPKGLYGTFYASFYKQDAPTELDGLCLF
ncbi:MAG: Uma2 family endonuclease [Desulfatirhabdiaceae bacterium]